MPQRRSATNDKTEALRRRQPKAVSTPENWPSELDYISRPVHSAHLGSTTIKSLQSPITSLDDTCTVVRGTEHSNRVCIRAIDSPNHPACGQNGLFAACSLEPGSLIVPYLGYVHGNEPTDTDSSSNYDISLDRDVGVSVDAAKMGNEARFVNDYRGVPEAERRPNAEFRDCWVGTRASDLPCGSLDGRAERDETIMERCVGVFVLSKGKRAGTRRARGIYKGEEILVSYGKGFWKELEQGQQGVGEFETHSTSA